MTTGRSGRSRGRRCGPARDPRRGPRQHRAGGGTAPTSVSGTHRGSPDRASPPGSRPVRSSPGTRTPKQAQGCRAPLHGRAEHVLDNEMARHRRPCGARASHRAVPSSGVALDLRAAQRFEGSGRARAGRSRRTRPCRGRPLPRPGPHRATRPGTRATAAPTRRRFTPTGRGSADWVDGVARLRSWHAPSHRGCVNGLREEPLRTGNPSGDAHRPRRGAP